MKSLPWFIKPKFIQDRKQRAILHPDYDKSTLYIPPDELNKFTGVMRQYWHFKCLHYDKVVVFMIGKFYEIFYEDAILCQKYLDLNWMGDKSKLHVGFPCVSLGKNGKLLVDQGLRVCVVDQIDPDAESEQESSPTSGVNSQQQAPSKSKKKKDKNRETFLGRKVSAILSKGLFSVE